MKKRKLMLIALAGAGVMLSNCKKAAEPVATQPETASTKGKIRTLGTVLFNGDATNGTSIWKAINIEGTGALSTVNDETSTLCWKYLKPSGSHRTETRGAVGFQADEGDNIYIGWTSKIYMPTNLQTEAIFQWKSYPTAGSQQNHPLMLRTKNGNLELQHFDASHTATIPWSTSLSTSTWLKFVLRIKVSRNPSIGYIELWYNGVKQTLSNGNQRLYCQTLDVDDCDPKWGVYGGDASQVTHIVKKIRIADNYADAAQ